MKYEVVPVTPFAQNCTVVWCEQTRQAAIIDPGGDLNRVMAVIEREQLTVEKILATHGHMDHVGGVAELVERLQVPVEGPHRADQFWITMIPQQSQMFGFPGRTFSPNRWLEDGDEVTLGGLTLQVLHCPGHTPGHVVFFEPQSRFAQVGDVLFNGSVGRTDFPGGDHQQLVRSIKDKLFPLGDDVVFVPGHGPESTFGHERRTNPFVSGQFG
ncbi:MAG: MBL fold metallo-hydrolase [Pseudomonadota bacterium]|nr:MBL fold metallo-hydrolase [Pseudomonadota bacterium]